MTDKFKPLEDETTMAQTKQNLIASDRENLIPGSGDTKSWIMNRYRVLLTRARLSTVIWVPEGDVEDETRAIKDLNTIAAFLKAAGARPL